MFAELTSVAEAPALARWRRLSRGDVVKRPSGKLGAALMILVTSAALLGPLLAPHDPFSITGGSLAAPSVDHPMGTDALGRDVFSAVLHGARNSLLIASLASMIALSCGTCVGLLSGYRGGMVDNALMRATELFQVIPRFFFAVVTIALLGAGLDRLVFVIGFTSWPTMARLVRGEVIAMRDLDFVRAAEAMGGSVSHIMRRQLLPNLLPTMIVATGVLFGQVLLLEATLGFLGLGDPGAISWGAMAAQSQGFLRVAWWLALFPGLAITIAVVGVNLLADAFSAAHSAE